MPGWRNEYDVHGMYKYRERQDVESGKQGSVRSNERIQI